MAISSGVRCTLSVLFARLASAAAPDGRTIQAMPRTAPLLAALLVLPLTAAAGTKNIWITQAEVNALPASGTPYGRVYTAANAAWPAFTIADQDAGFSGSYLYAGALMWMRKGDSIMRAKVRDGIMSALANCPIDGTPESVANNYAYSPARFILGLVISADMIDLGSYDPTSNATFVNWLTKVRTAQLRTPQTGEGFWINQMHETNASTTIANGTARLAASLYIGDAADVDNCYRLFKAYTDQSYYRGRSVQFVGPSSVGDYYYWCFPNICPTSIWRYRPTWVCTDTSSWTIISPLCVKTEEADGDTATIDGAVVNQVSRRNGSGGGRYEFTWPPDATGCMYSWVQIAAYTQQAELLYRAGYPAYEDNGKGLMRMLNFMTRAGGTCATPEYPEQYWIGWLANKRYGSNFFPTIACTGHAHNCYWTDWTHGSLVADVASPARVADLTSP